MKKIQIVRLTLDNFKCHRHLTLQLDGRNATLYGDNATGKTSVYDALTWLLFGKDSAGNGEKNIEIKPLDSTGSVIDHSAITSVEAELSVDGEITTLKRTYREVWSTKRGTSVETYDGNTSEYFVDGVPCKKYAFESKIKELVPEDTFRLLTAVGYFPGDLKWQERRAILFDMAGTLTDREIMAMDAKFAPLLEGMGKLSLDDYKKKLAAEKRGFVGIKDQTPARLDECQKTVRDLAGLDFAGAKAALADLEQRQRDISAQLIALDHDSAADAKRLEIRSAELERQKLDGQNAAFRAQQTAGAVDADGLRRQRNSLESRLTTVSAFLTGAEKNLAGYDKAIEDSRARWIAVNGEVFTGGSCPTCGQQLPFDQLQAATAAFEKQKRARLDEIMRTANSQKESKAQAEERIKSLRDEIATLEADILRLDGQISAADAAKVSPVDMDGYAEAVKAIQARVNALNAELSAMMGNAAQIREQLRSELGAVQEKISQQQAIIGKESILQYTNKRVGEIQADARNAAQALESIEKMLYLADEYTRYKTQYVESSVNSLFRIARFRLFREQANGGVEERCDVVYDGVPYIGLNNGMKINVGIDIINALSRHYGVTVPLFVDNAEGVTRLEQSEAQVIRLFVSESDKELRCVNEN